MRATVDITEAAWCCLGAVCWRGTVVVGECEKGLRFPLVVLIQSVFNSPAAAAAAATVADNTTTLRGLIYDSIT
ncbi:hypothetical protein E2C01_007481 [Portunus trituberculatus]|uniref:Uncharacterized protein n=1 Tax=Portunus trituberculatus TaxID=210409 RepID=A0A5B7CZ52_PORTR|nr:hypothetical protein [Portunus trituberculatus]